MGGEMSELLSVEAYLKLTKKERIELHRQKEEEEDFAVREEMRRDLEHEPGNLKDKQSTPNKKTIRLCWWLADAELHGLAEASTVLNPARCPYLDRNLYRCTNFENGWIECEDVALRIKSKKQDKPEGS